MHAIDAVERQLFLEGIFLKYGYDFREYSLACMNRRLSNILNVTRHKRLIDVLKECLDDSQEFEKVLANLTIGTTEFFRDPGFYKSLRENVIPVLKTYPSINIWCAGCSTGEEPISLAIMLKEEGLLSRSTIYATDINPVSLKTAQRGIFPTRSMEYFAKSYSAAGGDYDPSSYYTSEYGYVLFNNDVRQNIVYSTHNLATDSTFVEAHLILCRNVLIYFNRELQNTALTLFRQSLARKGYLGIGSKEALRFTSVKDHFSSIDITNNIFRLNEYTRDQRIHDQGGSHVN